MHNLLFSLIKRKLRKKENDLAPTLLMVLSQSYLLEYGQSPTPNDGVGDFLSGKPDGKSHGKSFCESNNINRANSLLLLSISKTATKNNHRRSSRCCNNYYITIGQSLVPNIGTRDFCLLFIRQIEVYLVDFRSESKHIGKIENFLFQEQWIKILII